MSVDVLSGILLAVLLFLVAWYFINRREPFRGIPEPSGKWPILGHLMTIDKNKPHLTFAKWAQECGGMYQIQLLFDRVIVLSGPDELREALVVRGKEFAGRSRSHFRSSYMSDNYQDLLLADPGQVLSTMRKFAQRELRMYDLQGERSKVERITTEIIEELIEDLISTNGEPTEPKPLIQKAVNNIMAALLTGRKYTRDDEMFKMLVQVQDLVCSILTVGGEGARLDAFPWLRFFGNKVFNDMNKVKMLREKIIQQVHSDIAEDFADGDYDRALVHALKKAHKDPNSKESILSDLQVENFILNLFIGGSVTTINTLHIFFNLLINNPEVQKMILKEVMTVIGKERRPTLEDRQHMPFTRAVVLELLRISTILPIAVPHRALVDTSIKGKLIPEGTNVFMNLWGLHHDPKLWQDANEFKPERFLDSDGQLLPPDHTIRKQFLPFGSGPRVCVGESIALGRVFLVIATLVQRVHVDYDYSQPAPSCHPDSFTLGIALSSESFTARMFKRS